uniref:Uncharacterized protein n=1 Tax=Arundo donax TaxID=35708 RepID=A0A0A8Z221_ARUDO
MALLLFISLPYCSFDLPAPSRFGFLRASIRLVLTRLGLRGFVVTMIAWH